MDYAESEKMKSVLMLPVKNESFSLNQPSEVRVCGFCFAFLKKPKNRVHPLSVEGFDLSTLHHLPLWVELKQAGKLTWTIFLECMWITYKL